MRVLTLTNMYPTPDEPWFGCFVRDQVDGLRAVGVQNTVLSFDGRPDWREYGRAVARLRSRLREDRFDLVHAHYGLSGAVAMAQRRLPVVTTFWGSDTGFIRWQGRVSWFVARATTPLFVSRAGALLLGLPRATVIPSAVNVAHFIPCERDVARRTLGWAEEGRYVLLPGPRSRRAKGAPLFDAAVCAIEARSGAINAVSLEGFSRDEVVQVMNAVDVTLMTSESEGSPVAVRESLACLTPVVSVDVGDVAEVISGLPGCSIRARDPADLAAGALEAMASPRAPELRARAEEYSRQRIADRIVDVYERVVRAGRS
jgi:Glycosyl transferases group 1/Glycosyltransferase Family 4